MIYLLVCVECDNGPMPFPGAAERGRWAVAHYEGTGHDRWRVIDMPWSEE